MDTTQINQNGVGQIPQPPSAEEMDLDRWRREEPSFVEQYLALSGVNEAQARRDYMFHCREFD